MSARVRSTRWMVIAGLVLAPVAAPAQGGGGAVPVATPAVPIRDARGAPALGSLVHRGRAHALRDVLDPAYRARSSDPFARGFSPSSMFATWAGL